MSAQTSTIRVDLAGRGYDIAIGPGLIDRVGELSRPLLAAPRVIIVSDEAVAPLEGALKEAPGQPDLLVALGQAYYKTGRFTDARSRLEEAARRDPAGPAGRRAMELIKNFPK